MVVKYKYEIIFFSVPTSIMILFPPSFVKSEDVEILTGYRFIFTLPDFYQIDYKKLLLQICLITFLSVIFHYSYSFVFKVIINLIKSRIFKWVIIPSTIVFLLLFIIKSITFDETDKTQIKDDKILKKFWGLELNTSLRDVLFAKGKPTEQDSRGQLIYATEDYSYSLLFKDSILVYVHFTCTGMVRDSKLNQPERAIGSDFKAIEFKYGKPEFIREGDDFTSRIYFYDKYHRVFGFEKGKVVFYGMYNPKFRKS